MYVIGVISPDSPRNFQYDELPDGTADVWIRDGIVEGVDEDGNPVFTYNEAYFKTDETEESIREDLESWTEYAKEWTPEVERPIPERVEVLEAKVDYLMIMEGL